MAALGFAVAHRRPGKDEPRAIRIEIAPPEGATLGWSDIPAVSPDGERIAFSAFVDGNSHLFVRPLSSFALTRIPGSEGASGPFWSPDGRHLGFFTSASLKKADLSGGPVEVLCALSALPPLGTEIRFRTLRGGGASWNRTGRVVFSWRGRLFQVPASGGECSPLGGRVEGETARHWPHFLPDGQRYLYLSEAAQPHAGAIYAASLGSDERKWIVENAYNVAYSPSGHLLFVRGQVLMAQAFDARRLELSGEPFPVTDRVALDVPTQSGRGLFHLDQRSAGLAGRLVPGEDAAGLVRPLGKKAACPGRACRLFEPGALARRRASGGRTKGRRRRGPAICGSST